MLPLQKCFEDIVLFVVLNISSHKALCHPCWFSCRVLFGPGSLVVFTHSYHHTQSLAFMGFNGWKHLVSLRFVHLGIGLFSPLMVAQWVILFFLGPVFTSTLWLFN
jgi:hypothetical protein